MGILVGVLANKSAQLNIWEDIMVWQQQWDGRILSSLVGCLIWGVWAEGAIAQIQPDSTLGSESSRVVPATLQGFPIQRIEGGASRGNVLFHSFATFNIGENERVYFANPTGIDTLVSRVTGNTHSTIAGTLGVNGSADLFLLNPNGIIFSNTAQLDIRGAFLASTADQFVFASGGEFSATNPQAPPLLNLEVPIGLQLGQVPQGDIENYGTLWVDGRSLTLFANNLLSPGSIFTNNGAVHLTAGNRIEVSGTSTTIATNGGAVSLEAGGDLRLRNGSAIDTNVPNQLGGGNAGAITLTADGNLSLQDSSLFSTVDRGAIGNAGAISLRAGGTLTLNNSAINNNLRGIGSGAPIRLEGDRITITNGSSILSFTDGIGDAGAITFQVRDLLNINRGSLVSVGSNPDAIGDGGSIRIRARRIVVSEGVNLFTFAEGNGNAGVLDIRSAAIVLANSVLSAGVSEGSDRGGGGIRIRVRQFNSENTVITADAEGNGVGGNLLIRAETMEVRGFTRGNQISSIISTNSTGSASAGNLTIQARYLDIVGTRVSTETSGTGDGGNLTIQVADQLTFSGPGVISASVLGGNGAGGNVTLDVGQLTLQNQGQIASGTFSDGDAGRLTIRARDSIHLIGIPDSETRTGLFTQSQGNGQAGTLEIFTPLLDVNGGATVSVSGIAAGAPGNLVITADRILLNQGFLEARTVSGEGANIQLDVADRLILRDRSQILAEAQGTGNGGNIRINSPFMIAVPIEDSDITANAFEGNGGNINIMTQAILGLEFRPELTPLSDITASSEFGLDGTVVINTPAVDPTQGLVELPQNPVDATAQIGQVCPTGPGAAEQLGRFVITGRGGIAPGPLDLVDSAGVETDWVSPPTPQNHPEDDRTDTLPIPMSQTMSSVPPSVTEAQSWIVGEMGEIHLVSETDVSMPHPSPCPTMP